jgi:hypothetical protein
MKQVLPVILLLLVILISDATYSQNNSSPYSIIGIGDIESGSFDRTSGMANTGLALSSGRFLYQANPASYSSLDDHFFHFEISARAKVVTYAGASINSNLNDQSSDFQFKKLSLAIKVKPRWAVSIGLMPFSTSNYSFFANKAIAGTNFPISAYEEGSGSTNLAYITNSYKISKNLSIGLQASYLFGQLEQKETIPPTSASDSALITTRNIVLTNPYFKLGLQYHKKINTKWVIAAGATGSLQTNLNTSTDITATSGNSTLVSIASYKSGVFKLPVTYSGGLAATLKDKFTFAADYNFQSWSNLHYSGLGYSLENTSRYSVGFEYSKKLQYKNQIFGERYFLQTGLFYSDSYLSMNGKQLNQFGGTIGAGFTPLRYPDLAIMGGLEIGKRGTTSNGLIRENYSQFTFTIAYRNFWLTKIKRYD